MNHTLPIPTVTVLIPAFNEEGNIANLLDSILAQTYTSCKLDKIIVMSDGSDDKTDCIVQTYTKSESDIHLVSDGKRMGKTRRLMMMYEMATSDVVIQFDADVVLASRTVINDIVRGLYANNAAAACGDRIALTNNSFTSRLIKHRNDMWRTTRIMMAYQNTIINALSCALAMKTKFAKSLRLNPSISSESQLIYCEVRKRNLIFSFIPTAQVFYKVPDTLDEYIKQSNRFNAEFNILISMYGQAVRSYDEVPRYIQAKSFISNFLHHPVLTIMTEWYFRMYKHTDQTDETLNHNGFWEPIKTTKTGIQIHIL